MLKVKPEETRRLVMSHAGSGRCCGGLTEVVDWW